MQIEVRHKLQATALKKLLELLPDICKFLKRMKMTLKTHFLISVWNRKNIAGFPTLQAQSVSKNLSKR